MSQKRTILAGSTALLLATLVPAAGTRAAVVFFDGFGDADYNNDGTTDGASVTDPLDVGGTWLRARGNSNTNFPVATVSDPSLDPVNSNAFNLRVIGTTSQRIVAAAFPAQDLAVGDQIVLEFDLRATSISAGGDRSFRFGLFNSNGTPAIETGSTSSDPAIQPTADDVGYIGRVEVGTPAGSTLEVQRNAAGQVLGGSVSSFGASSNNPDATINDTVTHHVTLILGNSADGFTGQLIFDSIASAIGTDPNSAITTRFDQVVIGTNGATMEYNIDNVQISVGPIPEPASLSLAALAAPALLRRRRR